MSGVPHEPIGDVDHRPCQPPLCERLPERDAIRRRCKAFPRCRHRPATRRPRGHGSRSTAQGTGHPHLLPRLRPAPPARLPHPPDGDHVHHGRSRRPADIAADHRHPPPDPPPGSRRAGAPRTATGRRPPPARLRTASGARPPSRPMSLSAAAPALNPASAGANPAEVEVHPLDHEVRRDRDAAAEHGSVVPGPLNHRAAPLPADGDKPLDELQLVHVRTALAGRRLVEGDERKRQFGDGLGVDVERARDSFHDIRRHHGRAQPGGRCGRARLRAGPGPTPRGGARPARGRRRGRR